MQKKQKTRFGSKFGTSFESRFASGLGSKGTPEEIEIVLPDGYIYLTFNGKYVTTNDGKFIYRGLVGAPMLDEDGTVRTNEDGTILTNEGP